MDWIEENGMLIRVFKLKDFVAAVEVINRVKNIAEKLCHHPDIELYNYNQLKFKLITHDMGEITEKDRQLAEEIDQIITAFSA